MITQLSVSSDASDPAVMNGKSSGFAVSSESAVAETELVASYTWSNYGFGDHSDWVNIFTEGLGKVYAWYKENKV